MVNLDQISDRAVDFCGNNALTVDVEDYYQVSAFAPYVNRSNWTSYESRLRGNLERILEMLDAAKAKCTFFYLGWMAERFQDLPKRIANLGHEIASHGYQHIRVGEQSSSEFRQDVDRTKKLLEDISGAPVYGYRAASFSIEATNDWARKVLRETGYRYSSSIYPIRHDRYSMAEAPRFPCRGPDNGVVELPVTTVDVSGLRLPAGGGGYFRLLPYAWTKWAISRVNTTDGRPAMFYFHPWELDPGQPRPPGLDPLTKFRHYVNLKGTEGKLRRLLKDFRWTTVKETFGDTF